MKIIALLLLIASFAHAELTDADLAKISREDIVKTITHMQELNRETQMELEQAREENMRLASSISAAQIEITQSRNLATVAAKEIEEMRQYAHEQQDEAETQKNRAEKEAKLAKHRGNLLGWIGAAAALFFGMQIARIIPPPYKYGVPIVTAAAGFAIARFLL